MEFKATLIETLATRFAGEEGRQEMDDINTHGISCGFSGFIYYSEINEFFNEFESEIEDFYYDAFGSEWVKDSGLADCDSFDAMRNQAVWGVVETYCANFDGTEDFIAA